MHNVAEGEGESRATSAIKQKRRAVDQRPGEVLGADHALLAGPAGIGAQTLRKPRVVGVQRAEVAGKLLLLRIGPLVGRRRNDVSDLAGEALP